MIKTLKNTLKAECFVLKYMFQTDTPVSIAYLAIIGIQYSVPLICVWLWKLILDEFTVIYLFGHKGAKIWIYLGIYLFLNVLVSVLNETGTVISEKLNRKATKKLDISIMKKLASVDTAFFDNPKNKDMLVAAQTSETHITGNMSWTVETIIRIFSFVAALVVFLSYNPVFGLLYMVTYIPGAIISYKNKVKVDQWSLDTIPETRKKDYYKYLLTGEPFAKDLRLYDLADYFKEKYNELWNKIRAQREKMFIKGQVMTFSSSLLTYIGIAIILLFSVRSVLEGNTAIGTLALYIGLAASSGENFQQIIVDIAAQVEIDIPRVLCFLDFMKYENPIKNESNEPLPDYLDIEFINLYFKYPGNNEYTLKNFSYKIEHGKKIALVGVNGSGKTTLIKLLLRFYVPESGEIRIGGKNISSYSPAELDRLFGVYFQDIQTYALSIRENIALSDIERRSDNDAVLSAANAAGADAIIKASPKGLDSKMTRMFENDGLELSGGQWQKIALARAFFRDSKFLVLDEPSSALDPKAEDYILSSFEKLCKNKGGILISHRLSSVMAADEIVLMENGSVCETGTHEELMKLNGRYAKMYSLQAKKYLEENKHENHNK